jgi:hypothetical protein
MADKIEELTSEALVRLFIDLIHRMIVHHGLWLAEVRHQMGLEKALKILKHASEKSIAIQMKRLGKTLGYELKDGVPAPLLNMPRESLLELIDTVSVNWLANDGVWFQSVEFDSGMNDAKRCNDSCWAHFSPFEAQSIKNLLGLPEHAGIEGLKEALGYRLYSRINVQSITDDGPNSIVFQMNDCRVQSARKRKGLEDYPCKSAGLVEYTYFARTIDPDIETECIGCPPDSHPDDWYCAWRFSIE